LRLIGKEADWSWQPLLEGKSFAQAPDYKLRTQLNFKLNAKCHSWLGIDYLAASWDDLLEQRQLPNYWTAGVGFSYQIQPQWKIQAQCLNLFDHEVITNRNEQ
jgi:outer membrane receptor for ferrienterochelin and colicin